MKRPADPSGSAGLVAPATSNARNSGGMLRVPPPHPLVAPGPLERMGVASVVLRPGSQHMLSELLPADPRSPLQVVVAERPHQQLRLVQPRGMGRREAGPPPIPATRPIRRRVARRVAGVAVLDQ